MPTTKAWPSFESSVLARRSDTLHRPDSHSGRGGGRSPRARAHPRGRREAGVGDRDRGLGHEQAGAIRRLLKPDELRLLRGDLPTGRSGRGERRRLFCRHTQNNGTDPPYQLNTPRRRHRGRRASVRRRTTAIAPGRTLSHPRAAGRAAEDMCLHSFLVGRMDLPVTTTNMSISSISRSTRAGWDRSCCGVIVLD